MTTADAAGPIPDRIITTTTYGPPLDNRRELLDVASRIAAVDKECGT